MRAITVLQPYAHLIASGVKPIENRTRRIHYRGPLMIHAGKSVALLRDGDETADLAFGAVVAVSTLVECLPIEADWATWGVYAPLFTHEHAHGPWCWILDAVRPLRNPVPWRGAQGLWLPPVDLIRAVEREL